MGILATCRSSNRAGFHHSINQPSGRCSVLTLLARCPRTTTATRFQWSTGSITRRNKLVYLERGEGIHKAMAENSDVSG
jgi:hypothetical protein